MDRKKRTLKSINNSQLFAAETTQTFGGRAQQNLLFSYVCAQNKNKKNPCHSNDAQVRNHPCLYVCAIHQKRLNHYFVCAARQFILRLPRGIQKKGKAHSRCTQH